MLGVAAIIRLASIPARVTPRLARHPSPGAVRLRIVERRAVLVAAQPRGNRRGVERVDEVVLSSIRHRGEVAAASLGVGLRQVPGPGRGNVLIPVVVATDGRRPLEELVDRGLVTDPRKRRVDVGDGARERHRGVFRAVAGHIRQAPARVRVEQRERARCHAERHLHLVQRRIGIGDRDPVAAIGRERHGRIDQRRLGAWHHVHRRPIGQATRLVAIAQEFDEGNVITRPTRDQDLAVGQRRHRIAIVVAAKAHRHLARRVERRVERPVLVQFDGDDVLIDAVVRKARDDDLAVRSQRGPIALIRRVQHRHLHDAVRTEPRVEFARRKMPRDRYVAICPADQQELAVGENERGIHELAGTEIVLIFLLEGTVRVDSHNVERGVAART